MLGWSGSGFTLRRSSAVPVIGTKSVGRAAAPSLTLAHKNYAPIPPIDKCNPDAGSGIIGGSFVTSPSWPASLSGSYIVGDYARSCLWALTPANMSSGPSTASLVQLAINVNPVQIVNGPGGDIYVVDLPNDGTAGSLYRFVGGDGPSAAITATPQNVLTNVDVHLSGSLSTGNGLQYAWDLDGDGAFNDAVGVTTTTSWPAWTAISASAWWM